MKHKQILGQRKTLGGNPKETMKGKLPIPIPFPGPLKNSMGDPRTSKDFQRLILTKPPPYSHKTPLLSLSPHSYMFYQ